MIEQRPPDPGLVWLVEFLRRVKGQVFMRMLVWIFNVSLIVYEQQTA